METKKNYVKGILFALIALMVVGMESCSKETVDSAGRDVAQNIIRTGTWKRQTKTVSTEGATEGVTTEILKEGESINFDKDNKAWTKHVDGTGTSVPYNMPTSRKMTFNGMDYDIKENIVGAISTLTLVNKTGPITTTIVFKRNW